MEFQLSRAKAESISGGIVAVTSDKEGIRKVSSLDQLNKKSGGHIARILKQEEFKGKKGQSKLIHNPGSLSCQAVLILGIAQKNGGDLAPNILEIIRQTAAAAVKTANQRKHKSLVFDLSAWPRKPFKEEELIQAAVEGMEMAVYQFNDYLSKDAIKKPTVKNVILLGVGTTANNKKAIQRGQAIAEGTILARDLVNTPAGDMTPRRLAAEAKKVGPGIQCRVYGKAEIAKLKMNSYLVVSNGSQEPPALIHMTYRPRAKTKKSVAIVGKGVTFDSGGLSIKPANSMETMKDDMAGAAAAIGLMKTLARVKPKCTVHVVVAATENMPSGSAFKPGDIAKAMNGKTIEILNTDAEGRLTLADALHFAIQKKPDVVIDMATLTGACLIALGDRCSGVMSNDDDLLDGLIDASEASGEMLWQLPLIDEYAAQIKSPIADVKNIGGRWGGTITSGLFLREFVGDARWAHIDIAGPSWTDRPLPYSIKGGTGCMVITLTRFILDY